ncbi:MAG: BTAD domain-containing putative transcriptional regulator [Sphingomicrobium sp.]
MDGEDPELRAPRRRPSPGQMLSNLKQAPIFRITVAYAVAAWLVIQIAATISPAFDAPQWLLRLVVLLAVAGLIITIGIVAMTMQPQAGDESVAQRGKSWRLLIGGGLVAALITAGTYFTKRTGLLFGQEEVRLAVLPFADLSPTRDKAYFSEGVAEEILSTLATEPGIKVLGRTSARQIERNPDSQKLRQTLGVTHLLEGSARSSGDALRVNVRLIDTSDGAQLWEEEYEGKMADVFSVQDQIASTVVKRVRRTFFSNEAARQTRETSVSAYQTYLAARTLTRNRTEKSLREAFGLAEKVVKTEPAYAPGQALLAELLFLLSDHRNAYGTIPMAEARKRGVHHARNAIRLAPKTADGYAALGLLLPPTQAVAPLERAILLDPSRADARSWLAVTLNELGRHDEALVQYRAAAEIEPLWAMPIANLVPALAAAGQQEEALKTVGDFRRRGGAPGQAYRFLSGINHWKGQISRAIAQGKAGLAKDPTLPDLRLQMAINNQIIGLTKHAPTGLPVAYTQFMDPFYSRDFTSLRRKMMIAGPRLWDAPDGHYAFFQLAASRDWAQLTALYGSRQIPIGEMCEKQPVQIVAVAMALREQGRARESTGILQCIRQRVFVEARMRSRNPFRVAGSLEFDRATLFGLDGNRADALRFLKRAIDQGWLGRPYSSQIGNYSQFDLLKGDRRVAPLQQRIDETLARERAAVLAQG